MPRARDEARCKRASSCDVIHREKRGRFTRNRSAVAPAGEGARVGLYMTTRRGRDILIVGKREETRCERERERENLPALCALACSLARPPRRKIAGDRYRSLPADAMRAMSLGAESRGGKNTIRIVSCLSYGRPGATSDYEGYCLRARVY